MSAFISVEIERRRALQDIRALPFAIHRLAASGLFLGAQETARIEKGEIPKSGGNLARTVRVRRVGPMAYDIGPTASYAEYVYTGTRPGYMPPIAPLLEWVRRQRLNSSGGRFRSTSRAGTDELLGRAKALRWHIKMHGTRANKYVDRTVEKARISTYEIVRAAVVTIAIGRAP